MERGSWSEDGAAREDRPISPGRWQRAIAAGEMGVLSMHGNLTCRLMAR